MEVRLWVVIVILAVLFIREKAVRLQEYYRGYNNALMTMCGVWNHGIDHGYNEGDRLQDIGGALRNMSSMVQDSTSLSKHKITK